jgi:antitoxin (DNA-binding transcriptional repressor) of toxin-antitoxin stability system
MRTTGLFEAKQKLSEIIERACKGEWIGISRQGKLTAIVIPARSESGIEQIFRDIERVRKRAHHQKR